MKIRSITFDHCNHLAALVAFLPCFFERTHQRSNWEIVIETSVLFFATLLSSVWLVVAIRVIQNEMRRPEEEPEIGG